MPPNRKKRIANSIYLFIASLTAGWMVGTALSPVVHIVISAIMGILVTIVAFLSGLPEKTGSTPESSDLLRRGAEISLFPIASTRAQPE